MSKEDDYRHNAAETLELANKSTSADKGRLLRLAEKWLDFTRSGGPAASNLRQDHYRRRLRLWGLEDASAS